MAWGKLCTYIQKGDRHNTANCRPVSLTSIICKIQELIIAKTTMNHLERNQILVDSQHGFRPKRGSTTLLCKWYSQKKSNGHQTDVAAMDFSKAFDKVSHRKLLYKLDWYGIRGNTLNWIQSFLKSRFQRVVLDGESSDDAPVVSGVPQGSVFQCWGPSYFCYT